MQVVHFTDPGCPFAFSAEPLRLRMDWTFGSQLEWDTRLIVLASDPAEYERKGFTPQIQAKGLQMLQGRHGMPIDTSERPRMGATEPACLAVVAVRRHAPDREEAMLRALRVHAMAGGMLDEQATIEAAAADAGVEVEQLRAWVAEPETASALAADRASARSPLPAALALDHKLAPSEDGGRRYTAPSIELHAGDRVEVAPGFQPWETWEALAANLDPTLERRGAPEDVAELLAWAPYPLATAEVAAIMQVSADDARAKLEAAGASFEAVGEDGYWRSV